MRQTVLLFSIFLFLVVGCSKDTQPPEVVIAYPPDGAVVSGIVNISVSVTDNEEIEGVSIYIDNEKVIYDEESPYSYSWNTTLLPDSSIHTIFAEARDKAGNVGVSEVITVTVYNGSEEEGVEVTQEDLTGDGTVDIKLDNGIMWVQVNGEMDDIGCKAYINAGGITGSPSFIGHPDSFGIKQHGMADQVAYWRTKSYSISLLSSSSMAATYRVVIVDTANGKEITRTIDVTLEAGKPYATVNVTLENTGTESFLYDEYPSHIHDGAHLEMLLSAEKNDIDGYISGVGTIGLTSLTWWVSYTPDTSAPYGILFEPTSGEAATLGYLEWDYPIWQVVAYYTGAGSAIRPKLDFMAQEFTLNPGETAHFRLIIAFHNGGYERGIEIYNEAAASR